MSVHIGLNFENEGRKIRAEGIHGTAVCHTGQGGRRQLQEGFQERLNTKVGQGRAKEYGTQAAAAHLFHIHFPTGAQQLHIVDQLLMLCLRVQKRGNLGIVQIHRLPGGTVLAGHTGERVPLRTASISISRPADSSSTSSISC